MKQTLTILLAYPGAQKMWRNWAQEENSIDFRTRILEGERCTASYAALELKTFLNKSMPELEILVTEKTEDPSPRVELCYRYDPAFPGGFELQSSASGQRVIGFDRNGLLNGVYELLRIQGWRFLEPGTYGESAPVHPTLDFLKVSKRCTGSFKHRMIDQYRESDCSVELLQWFSRNYVNVVFWKAAAGKFSDKLGMLHRKGGHLLQRIMNPDTPMEDGRTLWEAHPEWYGLPPNGIREKKTAIRTQLCLSNEEMIQWLSARICQILQTEMSCVDILDLWGFDTWGKTCSCEGCKDLGNGSDQNLYLLSRIQEYLDTHLGRHVMLNTISYEGTATMDPPTRKVPQNLIDRGSMVIFYPIKRCYRHLLSDETCAMNKVYRDSLEGWHKAANGLALWSGEYYNVSKYEDMPLVFGKLIPAEMRYYHAHSCTGATYMHNLSPNWGVRALTQLLHCRYAWDISTEEEGFITEYFERKYGVHAKKMRRIYDIMEQACKDIALWRNWGSTVHAAFSELYDPDKVKEVRVDLYPTEKKIILAMKKAVSLADKAVVLLRECLKKEQQVNWKYLADPDKIPPVLTPLDLEKLRYYDKLEHRIGEDLRGAVYGAEMLRIFLYFMELHYAFLKGKDPSGKWEQLEQCAETLNEMWIPVTYENPTPGLQILDGLTRAQVRQYLTRARGVMIRRAKKGKV